MRWLSTIMAALVLLCVASCPGGHKSYGGSSGSSTLASSSSDSSDNPESSSSDSASDLSGTSNSDGGSPGGGGESVRGGGLFGSGLPSEPGDYVNAGGGWVRMEITSGLVFMSPDQVRNQALTASGDKVSYLRILTPTEKQDPYTPELTSWIGLTSLQIGVPPYASEGGEVTFLEGTNVRGTDKSDWGAGRVLWEFTLPSASNQYYELMGMGPPDFARWALLYQP